MQPDPELYTIVLRKEESAGEWAWVARVPELPGCAATEDTPEEALRHIQQSIQTYLDLEREAGRQPPPPTIEFSGRFTVRVPKWLHRELKLQADADGVSLNQYVATILAHWVRYATGQREAPVVPKQVLESYSSVAAVLRTGRPGFAIHYNPLGRRDPGLPDPGYVGDIASGRWEAFIGGRETRGEGHRG